MELAQDMENFSKISFYQMLDAYFLSNQTTFFSLSRLVQHTFQKTEDGVELWKTQTDTVSLELFGAKQNWEENVLEMKAPKDLSLLLPNERYSYYLYLIKQITDSDIDLRQIFFEELQEIKHACVDMGTEHFCLVTRTLPTRIVELAKQYTVLSSRQGPDQLFFCSCKFL